MSLRHLSRKLAAISVDPRLSVDTTLRDDVRTVRNALRNPASTLQNPHERQQVRTSLFNLAGASVGYLGMVGLKYRVKPYHLQVSPDLWRGSRLNDARILDLQKRGIRSIVCLTAEKTQTEALTRKHGMGFLPIPIIDNTAPTFEQMEAFLEFVTSAENKPCYVHCQAGKGRTGVAVACYRMAVEGWPPEAALAEALRFGMAIPDQQAFVLQVGEAIRQGRFPRFPRF